MSRLILPKHLAETVVQEALRAYPQECCGLLIGQGTDPVVVSEIVPSVNLAPEQDRFLIDPQLQFDWIRKLRATEQRILGPYHSHPNGHDKPSRHDADMALERGQIWMIVPVSEASAGGMKAYEVTADEGTFAPVVLETS